MGDSWVPESAEEEAAWYKGIIEVQKEDPSIDIDILQDFACQHNISDPKVALWAMRGHPDSETMRELRILRIRDRERLQKDLENIRRVRGPY